MRKILFLLSSAAIFSLAAADDFNNPLKHTSVIDEKLNGAIEQSGKQGEKSIAELIKALKNKDSSVRESAGYELGKIGPAAKAAVPALIALVKTLKDKEFNPRTQTDVRGAAVKALGKIGPAAKAAVPALIEILKEKYSATRWAAATALTEIVPYSEDPNLNVGLIYYHGTGVDVDYEEAARWVRVAAEIGHSKAQEFLGFMYAKGHGVPQDDTEAEKWYAKGKMNEKK